MNKAWLDKLYRKYNRRKYVHPDPLEFLYGYPDIRDREIVGLIAASLAYGRVAQILKSVKKVLDKMRSSPREFLNAASERSLAQNFAGFKHRFTTDVELVSLLTGMQRAISTHGSLNECFLAGMGRQDATVSDALAIFAQELACCSSFLAPSPRNGSACKRLNLYLRWMVRKDAVDPGGWHGVSRSKLIVPLDTHMARIGRALGLTGRKSPNWGMTLEITAAFRALAPDDPVKYDFALTRFGIRDDMDMDELWKLTTAHLPLKSSRCPSTLPAARA